MRFPQIGSLAPLTALLSSSCCLLQLVLNVFSFSCAGFSVLTPYRPLFTIITLLLLTHRLYFERKDKKTVGTALISLVLIVSPELTQWVNQTHLLPIVSSNTYLVQIDGMQCIACANRIKNTLQSMATVESATLFFANSSAIVRMVGENTDHFLQKVIKAIDPKYTTTIITQW
ncbi:hypothetical protein BDF14DRAFT_1883800 [Spinellus fusiger]|nr:hypothetical protein BDF14DRAFT_1883800 [Spinellus fusiger]